MAVRRGRTVLDRAGTAVDRAAAAPEDGAFVAEDAAVSTGGRSGSAGATAAHPRGCGDAAAAVRSQTSSTRQCGTCLRRRVAAVAAQGGNAASTTNAQACAARGSRLAADADAAHRARHVRSGGAVQRGGFAGDQPGLTARAERGIAAHSGDAADISGTSQATARSETSLTA